MQKIKLDYGKLYGFKTLQAAERKRLSEKSLPARLGSKLGDKLGSKLGEKTGMKF